MFSRAHRVCPGPVVPPPGPPRHHSAPVETYMETLRRLSWRLSRKTFVETFKRVSLRVHRVCPGPMAPPPPPCQICVETFVETYMETYMETFT